MPMTREEAYAVYELGYGFRSICNHLEVDIITARFEDEDDVVEAMHARIGTPSPRYMMPFEDLPISSIQAFSQEANILTKVPDVFDLPAIRRYICIRYKLHEDRDLWLVNTFVERFQKLGNP